MKIRLEGSHRVEACRLTLIDVYRRPGLLSSFGSLLWEEDARAGKGSKGGPGVSEENKEMVRRMMEAINEGAEAAFVEEAFAPRAARRVGRLFAEFRSAFPDWREEIVELVAEGTRWRGASAARARTRVSS